MKYPKPEDRYSCEVLCDNFMEIEERFEELESDVSGKQIRLWMLPNSDSVSTRYDYFYIKYLVGAVEPTVDTVEPGDLVVCGLDGGLLYINSLIELSGEFVATTTAGVNGPSDPAEGAAVYFSGPAGYTPVKGTDYYTEDDKTEMVNLVLEALPVAEEASV